jgi:hypothetical protein
MSEETGKARTKKAPKGGVKPQSRSQRAGLQVRILQPNFSQHPSYLTFLSAHSIKSKATKASIIFFRVAETVLFRCRSNNNVLSPVMICF